MQIDSIDVAYHYYHKSPKTGSNNETHIKALPYLSVVQSKIGSYGISLDGGAETLTGEGNFFIAPSICTQKIRHIPNCENIFCARFIKSVAAICDAVKAKKRSKKTVNLSFDEWNVWYHDPNRRGKNWEEAPAILEDIYDFQDALLVGCMLMTLQNNCDRVKIACLAQLVNVIAPIMTERGGKAWCQTIFYPFMYGSNYGRGTVMRTVSKCDTYKTHFSDSVPYIETSVINDEEKREIHVFAVNRNLEEDIELGLSFESFGDCEASEHVMLYSDDLFATNSAEAEKVSPISVEVSGGRNTAHTVNLKKHSWNMITFKY